MSVILSVCPIHRRPIEKPAMRLHQSRPINGAMKPSILQEEKQDGFSY